MKLFVYYTKAKAIKALMPYTKVRLFKMLQSKIIFKAIKRKLNFMKVLKLNQIKPTA